MTHVDFLLLVFKFNNDHRLIDRVLAFGHDFDYSTINLWWHNDSVLVEEIIFKTGTNHITSCEKISNLQPSGGEVPLLILIKRWYINSSWHKHTS
jgi:hypothetical protein